MFVWIKRKSLRKFTFSVILLTALLAPATLEQNALARSQAEPRFPTDTTNIYIPLMLMDYPWVSPFGLETSAALLDSNSLLPRAADLHVGWARMGYQISWKNLQPVEGGPIQWGLLATFEDELRGMKQNGIRPVVMIKDSPVWALDTEKARDANGALTSCGPVAQGKFAAYATFIQQLVNRYKTLEFNVHDWELGNEPDVDPTLVPPDQVFGCWGDIDDPYYGGEYYGEMLKAVTPAIRQSDSTARIWIGGLLLASPSSTDPDENGRPELFLKGILEAGAAPYFDVLPYHWYPMYFGPGDMDYTVYNAWYDWGGGTVGKARYLRQIMTDYGIQKPIVLNESAFGCKELTEWCEPPDISFYESQASHLVRFFVRGLSENVSGFFWYTLNGSGWRYTGLLDANQQPRLAYVAYQQLSTQLHLARYLNAVDYGAGIEAYAFRRTAQQVHILWSDQDQAIQFSIPTSKFIQAVSRDGVVLYDLSNPPPEDGSGNYLLEVGFSPIYLIRNP